MAGTPSEPPPIVVVLPDRQEVTGRLLERQQVPSAWLYRVAIPAWRNSSSGDVEAAWYTVWVQAPDHVRPVDGVSYDSVPTTRLPAPSAVDEALGPRRPSGWVLEKLDQRGPDRGVLHAPDCSEAPENTPVLPLERALDMAETAGVRLCSLCGAAAELDPLLKGFDHGFGTGG